MFGRSRCAFVPAFVAAPLRAARRAGPARPGLEAISRQVRFMRFRHAIAGVTVLSAAATGAAAVPALAAQERDGAVPNGLAHRYETLYEKVSKLGAEPGRDIVKDGVRHHGKPRAATAADVRHSVRTLRQMHTQLTAPAPTATTSASTTTSGGSASVSGSSTSSSSSLPSCTWQPESGGDYNAVNSSSGARGKYQIMPETYAANGGDGSWSPADQERVAQNIWNATGGAPWTDC